MSMTFGEFEVSPASLKKLLAAPQVGRRYVLLDSVRDAAFLNLSSKDALGNTIPDMGLGCVDNGLFFYTSRFVPGSPTIPRSNPVKFFWIGSPLGTNDINDVFSIFVADVNPFAFYAGVPASAWLSNPRLLLSPSQAKNDIVSWFDANYPYTVTPASGGIGQETPNSQTNSQYGTLTVGGSPGNISGMDSLDGQFWPIYDRVDNTVLLYFSVKTPNCNTLSIYCYKITDTEFANPVTSAEFKGGLASSGWYPQLQQFGGIGGVGGTPKSGALSSHRFAIVSPDPLVNGIPVSGQQQAVMVYSYGAFDSSTPDHGACLVASWVADIHASPTFPSATRTTTSTIQLDQQSFPVDKLGSINPVWQVGTSPGSGYSVIFNAPSQRDARYGSNKVVISSMNIRIAYFEFASQAIWVGSIPILNGAEAQVMGTCRPQFTTLPDGIPKLLYANWSQDQNLTLGYVYLQHDSLSPSRQSSLLTNQILNFGPQNYNLPIYNWGKRRLRMVFAEDTVTNNPSPNAQVSSMSIFQCMAGEGQGSIYGAPVFAKQTLHFYPGPAYMKDGTSAKPPVFCGTMTDLLPFTYLVQTPSSRIDNQIFILED
jgi:hypothetical protein